MSPNVLADELHSGFLNLATFEINPITVVVVFESPLKDFMRNLSQIDFLSA